MAPMTSQALFARLSDLLKKAAAEVIPPEMLPHEVATLVRGMPEEIVEAAVREAANLHRKESGEGFLLRILPGAFQGSLKELFVRVLSADI